VLFLSSLFSTITYFLENKVIQIISLLFLRIIIAFLNNALMVFTLEKFSTNFRAKGFGYCIIIGKLSASLMPFILTFMYQ